MLGIIESICGDPGTTWSTWATSPCGVLLCAMVSLVWLVSAAAIALLHRGFLRPDTVVTGLRQPLMENGTRPDAVVDPRISRQVAMSSCVVLLLLAITMLVIGILNQNGWISKDIDWAISAVCGWAMNTLRRKY